VYERRWRRWSKQLTSARWRWLVITRFALKDVFASKAFLVYYVFCALPSLVALVTVYVTNNSGILSKLGLAGEASSVIDSFVLSFLQQLFYFQAVPAFFLAVIVSPGLVAPDLANNAMPLLLSRPINRRDYVVGKMSILVLLMSPVTWCASMLVFVMQAVLKGGGWWHEHLRLGIGHLVGHGAWIMVISLLSLAISAWVRLKPLARGMLLGLFLILGPFSAIFNAMLRTDWGLIINLGAVITIVVSNIFDPVMKQPIPPLAAWLALVAVASLSMLVLARKIKAHEVVR